MVTMVALAVAHSVPVAESAKPTPAMLNGTGFVTAEKYHHSTFEYASLYSHARELDLVASDGTVYRIRVDATRHRRCGEYSTFATIIGVDGLGFSRHNYAEATLTPDVDGNVRVSVR